MVDPAEEVPLQSPPGEPPTLADGWGYISLSHCVDACLLAWSLMLSASIWNAATVAFPQRH